MNHRVYNKAAWQRRYPYGEIAAAFFSYGKTGPTGCGSDGRELSSRPLDKALNAPNAAGLGPTPISRHRSAPFPPPGRDFLAFFRSR